MKTVGILNEEGIRRLAEFLARLKAGEDVPVPVELLDDPETSAPLIPPVEIDDQNFVSRLDAAQYLAAKIGGLRDVNYNRGLWAWLALFYFDRVCPPDSSGHRTVKDEALYIPGSVSWRYY